MSTLRNLCLGYAYHLVTDALHLSFSCPFHPESRVATRSLSTWSSPPCSFDPFSSVPFSTLLLDLKEWNSEALPPSDNLFCFPDYVLNRFSTPSRVTTFFFFRMFLPEDQLHVPPIFSVATSRSEPWYLCPLFDYFSASCGLLQFWFVRFWSLCCLFFWPSVPALPLFALV